MKESVKTHRNLFLNQQVKIYVGRGWQPIVDSMLKFMGNEVDTSGLNLILHEIKEEYGELIVKYENGNERVDNAVMAAQMVAKRVCQSCGSTENVYKRDGHFLTLCDFCSVDSMNPCNIFGEIDILRTFKN